MRFGRYRLLGKLAQGGMGEVFLARQEGPAGFQKTLVIKRLLAARAAEPDVVRMFLAEGRIAARLDHPNIVQIFEVGRVGGEYFIAMEHVFGKNVRTVLVHAAERGILLPEAICAQVVIGVCSALHHAHTLRDDAGRPLGIVHRDVTPDNVLLSFDGDVKLADFGIAKVTALAAETQAGVVKGKVAYMSPEQVRGEELDARSDVFSVGVLLHEMVCGRRLFRRATDHETLRAVETAPIPSPSVFRDDFPEDLEALLMRALARERAERFATADELLVAVERASERNGWRTGRAEVARFLMELFGQPSLADLIATLTPAAAPVPVADASLLAEGSTGLGEGSTTLPPEVSAETVPSAPRGFAPLVEVMPTVVRPPDFGDPAAPPASGPQAAPPAPARRSWLGQRGKSWLLVAGTVVCFSLAAAIVAWMVSVSR